MPRVSPRISRFSGSASHGVKSLSSLVHTERKSTRWIRPSFSISVLCPAWHRDYGTTQEFFQRPLSDIRPLYRPATLQHCINQEFQATEDRCEGKAKGWLR